jgi:predicted Fe-Mo cluster-binding NifX family protein
MKIAIPIENGRLHGHFGGCREFAIVRVDTAQQVALDTQVLPAPNHQPGVFPRWLQQQGVNAVIVGGIGRRALAHFAEQGITVCAGPADASVDRLISAYLQGSLNQAPEACEHHDYHHGRDRAHHHGEQGAE